MYTFIVFDNQGDTLDRYTIFPKTKGRFITANRKDIKQLKECISASESGLGVFQYCHGQIGNHLGKKITFETLSKELQNKVSTLYNG